MDWDRLTSVVQKAAVRTFKVPGGVLFEPDGLPALQVDGIFRSAHVEADPASGMQVSSNQPVLDLKLEDLPREPGMKDFVTVQGTKYLVRDVQRDGEGMVTLLLHVA